MNKKLTSALISVFNKDGLAPLVKQLKDNDVTIYSTGGTQKFIEDLGINVIPVEQLTSYPSILGGRVKTLHPSVFGGILGRRNNEADLLEMNELKIPKIDLVIVDLYPFEQTLEEEKLKASSFGRAVEEAVIIEKIDIGGPSMIRAAAKNFNDVVVIASKESYKFLTQLLAEQNAETSLPQRRSFAASAFEVVANYDVAIAKYFNPSEALYFLESTTPPKTLRYGENPHQSAVFYGDLSKLFQQLSGKELSYNNLVDVSAAIELLNEWYPTYPRLAQGKENHTQPLPVSQTEIHKNSPKSEVSERLSSPMGGNQRLGTKSGMGVVFAVLKHTNVCGMASRETLIEAWQAALAGDPESAFGGVLICNTEMDKATTEAINEIFFEVLIAPSYTEDAFKILSSKKNRIILKQKPALMTRSGGEQSASEPSEMYQSLLDGVLIQSIDNGNFKEWKETSGRETTEREKEDLVFANIVCKHLKSNAIALVKNKQLIGKGCGQTSRIDALRQAIEKAKQFNFNLDGAVMASDAFFPFDDCVKLGHTAGITAFIQPGGSIRDKESSDYCKENNLAMVLSGMRHFKH